MQFSGRPGHAGRVPAFAKWVRWRRLAGLATTLAGLGLTTIFAAAASAAPASAPPPAPHVTPGVSVASPGGVWLFYTGTDGSVYMRNAAPTAPSPPTVTRLGGHLVSAPTPIDTGYERYVFGQGTDNRLWWTRQPNGTRTWTAWTSLGGQLTSKPTAVTLPNLVPGPGAPNYSVYVRGTDGAVWGRDHSAAGWNAWRRTGGNVLAGTGPTAAYLDGTYLMVTGADTQLYIEKAGVTGFTAAGGRTTASPALTALPYPAPPALIGFVRGTDNAGYYHRFQSGSPGWHPMGGRLTSGLAAGTYGYDFYANSYAVGLGADNEVYLNIGNWMQYPPTFTGWAKVTG